MVHLLYHLMRLEVENASKLIFCQDGSPSKFHYLLGLNSECLGPCTLLVLLLEAVKSPVGELPSTLVEKVMEQGMGREDWSSLCYFSTTRTHMIPQIHSVGVFFLLDTKPVLWEK